MDLADATDFVCGIGAFDSAARACDRFVISGASTFAALTGAVVRHLATDLARVVAIGAAIAPSPLARVGLSVISTLMSYASQPLHIAGSFRIPVGNQVLGCRPRGSTATPRARRSACYVGPLRGGRGAPPLTAGMAFPHAWPFGVFGHQASAWHNLRWLWPARSQLWREFPAHSPQKSEKRRKRFPAGLRSEGGADDFCLHPVHTALSSRAKARLGHSERRLPFRIRLPHPGGPRGAGAPERPDGLVAQTA